MKFRTYLKSFILLVVSVLGCRSFAQEMYQQDLQDADTLNTVEMNYLDADAEITYPTGNWSSKITEISGNWTARRHIDKADSK
jgi:hypothetical protein